MRPILLAGVAMLAAMLPQSARAEDEEAVARRLLGTICLPYVARSASLERSIDAAEALYFRRGSAYSGPLEPWASEVELVSRNRAWRLRLEEGQVDDAYVVTCTIVSQRASPRELARAADRVLRRSARWSAQEDGSQWTQRTRYPDEVSIAVEVKRPPAAAPALVATGAYR